MKTIFNNYNYPLFTDKEKLAIFEKALAIIKYDHKKYGHYISGFCKAFRDAMYNLDYDYHDADSISYNYMKIYFPEIYKYKPHKLCSYWWRNDYTKYGKLGTEKRMKILETEIEVLKKKLRKK
jgi:hypothetical protein